MSCFNFFTYNMDKQYETRELELNMEHREKNIYAIINYIHKRSGYTLIKFYGWNHYFRYNAVLDYETYSIGSVVLIQGRVEEINNEKNCSLRVCENETIENITGCKLKCPIHTNTIKKIWALQTEIKCNIILVRDYSTKLIDILIESGEGIEYAHCTKKIVELQNESDKLYTELKDIINTHNDGWTPF